jgi:hypothetical protein
MEQGNSFDISMDLKTAMLPWIGFCDAPEWLSLAWQENLREYCIIATLADRTPRKQDVEMVANSTDFTQLARVEGWFANAV